MLSPPPSRNPVLECLVLGNLPVLASAWAGQYVREIAAAAGKPVAYLRVQAEFVVDANDLGRLKPEGRPESAVLIVLVRDDGIEPVVPAGHLENDEDRVLPRLGRVGGALDEPRHRGAGGD